MEDSPLMDWELAVTKEVRRDPKELQGFSTTEKIVTHHTVPPPPLARFISLGEESRKDLRADIFHKTAKRMEKITDLFRKFRPIFFPGYGWYIRQAEKEAFLGEAIELLTIDQPLFFEFTKSLSGNILLTKKIVGKIECFVRFAQPTRQHNGWYFPTRNALDQFIAAIIEIFLEEPYKAEFFADYAVADYAVSVSQWEMIRRIAIAMTENRIGI